MSELAPSIVPLALGLNLQAPKLMAEPGSVLDTLNYEQVDFQGQKRIDGFVRYDGSLGSYQDIFYRVPSASGSTGTIIYDGGKPAAVVVGNSGGTIVAIIDDNYRPSDAQEIKSFMTPGEHYAAILEYNQVLRNRATTLDGAVAGLHWFEDRLYAVAPAPSGIPNVPAGVGTLWQSRTERQAQEELGNAAAYGWAFIHQGWILPFVEGISLYGSLPAANQNRQNIGVQGPTSVSGSSGSPLSLIQKVKITNGATQANGWKSSDTPTSYILKASDVEDTDGVYVYADAYIEWDGETRLVSAPGANWPVVPEYSATATIEVEVD